MFERIRSMLRFFFGNIVPDESVKEYDIHGGYSPYDLYV